MGDYAHLVMKGTGGGTNQIIFAVNAKSRPMAGYRRLDGSSTSPATVTTS